MTAPDYAALAGLASDCKILATATGIPDGIKQTLLKCHKALRDKGEVLGDVEEEALFLEQVSMNPHLVAVTREALRVTANLIRTRVADNADVELINKTLKEGWVHELAETFRK